MATIPVVTESPAIPGGEPTAAPPAVPAAPHKSGFIRLIDKLGGFFHTHEGTIQDCAIASESIVGALTPFGPEYDLVVNAIVGMRRTAAAAQVAGVQVAGPDQMKVVFAATMPTLSSILSSKGIAKDDQDAIIATYLQAVYSLHTLPAVTVQPALPAKA